MTQIKFKPIFVCKKKQYFLLLLHTFTCKEKKPQVFALVLEISLSAVHLHLITNTVLPALSSLASDCLT